MRMCISYISTCLTVALVATRVISGLIAATCLAIALNNAISSQVVGRGAVQVLTLT